MHNYSQEPSLDRWVHVGIVIISAGLAFIVNGALIKYDWRITGSISFFTIFTIIEWVFDRYLWKILGLNHILGIANLNGSWKGHLLIGQAKTKYEASIKIKQTWSKILIQFSSNDANGRSFGAAMTKGRMEEGKIELVYNYYAQSANIKSRNHFDHYGTSILTLEKENNELKLSGQYYTEKNRNSDGDVLFIKET